MPIRFQNSKKGMDLKEAAYLVFAAILVIALYAFFTKLQGVIQGNKDDGSMANYDRLYEAMRDMIKNDLNSDKDSKEYIIMNYYLGIDHYLVGFDTTWSNNLVVAAGDNIFKPFKCGNAACLCLYEGRGVWKDAADRDTQVQSCRSDELVGQNIIFSSEGAESVIPRTAGEKRADGNTHYLVLYGRPKLLTLAKVFRKEHRIWEVAQIYVEDSYNAKSKTHTIYLSSIDTSNPAHPATKRKMEIDAGKKLTS